MALTGTLLYIVILIIIVILIVVLLKFLFAVIFIAPYAYAQNTEAPVIDYGPNGIPAPSWPGGMAPPLGTFGTPNLANPADLFPGGPGWGFNDFLIQKLYLSNSAHVT